MARHTSCFEMNEMKSERLKRAHKRRGAAQVEYAFLLGVFVIPMVPVFIAGGIEMFRGWEERRTSLLRPVP